MSLLPQNLKNLSALLLKKRVIFLLLFFIFVGIFSFPLKASAGLLATMKAVANALTNVPVGIPVGLVWVAAQLMAGVATLAEIFLNWILSPDFMPYSYTNPAGNPVIAAGLPITQGLVNMILVLVLVYIALATILRLAGYETKKLLITFIIIALLVNFAPVICGLIVDASNIIMSFFLKGSAQGGIVTTLEGSLELAGADFFKIMTEKAAAYGDLAKKGLQFAVFVFLFLCTAFLYFIFAFVFLFRYMVIWILVILSPIAFACYILPVTKKYWSLWWNQFVQWNIIGITCGFFLNLAVICAKKIDVGIPPEKALGASLLPNLVPVVFLGLAFVFGLQTGAMGASSIIGIASRAQKRSGKWVGAKVWKKGVRPWAEPLAKRAAGGASKIAERVGGAGFTIRGRKIRPLGAMRWFWPEKLQKFAEARPTAEEEEKKAGAYASHTSGRMIANKSVTGFEGLGHLLSIIHRGDSQDLFKGFKDELGVETDEELLKDERFKKGVLPLLHLAQDAGMLTDIRRRDPRLAALLPGQKWAGEQYRKAESPEQAIAMATEEQRRQHLKDTEREAFENETVVETAMEKGSGYWSSVDTQVKRGVETSTRTMNKIFSKWVREKRGNLAEKLNSAIAAGDKELETATRNEINGLFMTEFRDDFRETHGGKDGFFEALRLPSFRKRGWRAPQYKTEAEMEAPPPAATPGGAVLRRAQVARRAHEIWEREGRPEGREKEHWAQAEREMSPPPLPTGRRGPSGRRPGGRRPSGRRPGGGGGAPSGRRA